MRTAYRVLAFVVGIEVIIQAGMIAYAVFGEAKFIAGGGVINKAVIESRSADFDGVLGFPVHAINGQMVIPVITLAFLVVSFFAKVPKGVMWAGIVAGLVVLQVVLGIFGGDIPFVGLLHGINALALFMVAIHAARQASTTTVSAAAQDRATVA